MKEQNNIRQANVYFNNHKAGVLEKNKKGYKFTYNKKFMTMKKPISISMPIKDEPYENEELFPFFTGLLPEGWYLELICATLKIDRNDNFSILLKTCGETIGAISIREIS